VTWSRPRGSKVQIDADAGGAKHGRGLLAVAVTLLVSTHRCSAARV